MPAQSHTPPERQRRPACHTFLPRRACIATVLPLVVALGACTRDQNGSAGANEDTSQPGGTAQVAVPGDATTAFPLLVETKTDVALRELIHMSLLVPTWREGRLHYQGSDEHPTALARRWEPVGPDSAAVRFHLRPDAQWSDGRPVTAGDAAFTLGLMSSEALASPFRDQVERLDSVRVESDTTLTLFFRHRFPDLLEVAGNGIVPRHVFDTIPPDRIATQPASRDPA